MQRAATAGLDDETATPLLTYEGTEEIHTLVLGQAITGLAAYR